VTGQNGHSDPNEQRIPHTTTDAGIGAARDDHLLTVAADGPILLQDH
jgi:catalase